MAQAKPNVTPMTDYAARSSLSPHELDWQLLEAEQRFVDAAQQAAPYAFQLQLAREIVAIRMTRLVGQAGVMETAELTESVVAEMAKTGLYTQVIIDGLRGKAPDVVVDKISEVQGAFLEGAALIHAVATGAILDRVQNFKAPRSTVRFRDVTYAVLTDRIPRQLPDRRR